MKNKIISLLLLGSFAIGTLSSCTTGGKNFSYDIDETKFNIINADGTSVYTIVRPENASNDVLKLCVDFKDAILEKTGVELEIKSDFEKKGHAEFQRQDEEILIGYTNREETDIAAEDLERGKDFSIVQSGTRIAILAKSNAELSSAIDYFTENYIDAQSGTIAMDYGEEYLYKHEYPIESYTINGADISEYTVTYTDKVYKPIADAFNSFLTENYGKNIRVEERAKGAKNIIFQPDTEEYLAMREELHPLESKVIVDENNIILLSGILADTALDVENFASKYFNTEVTDKKIEYTVESSSEIKESPYVRIDDQEILAFVDKKAKERREYIINTPNTVDPESAGAVNKVFYISHNGDDSNDGRSPETAWRNISMLKNQSFMKGDVVLFERGGEYRGKFTGKAGVTYSAYGEGAKPVINGSKQNFAIPGIWMETDVENVYKCSMYFDNAGVILFDYSGEVGHYDETYGKLQVFGANGFESYKDLDSDLEFCNKLDTKELWLYCEGGNPGKRFSSIEIAEGGNMVQGSEEDVTIDNLMFIFGGAHGVGSGTVKNRKVQNCIFAWIGGSILKGYKGANVTRYGNAIEVYGGCDGYYVYDNWCYQIYDTGITHQYSNDDKVIVMDNIEYRGNLVELCHWSIEYYNRGSMPGSRLHNVHVHDNMTLYGAYGWGSVGREGGAALHNSFQIIDDVENYIVENNIFAYSKGNVVRYNEGGDRKINFKNNTYIQYYGRNLGYMFGKTQPYTGSALTQLKDVMKEENPTLVFLMHDAEREAEEAAKKALEDAGLAQ